jgi:hypothetical protein
LAVAFDPPDDVNGLRLLHRWRSETGRVLHGFTEGKSIGKKRVVRSTRARSGVKRGTASKNAPAINLSC